MSSTSSPPRRRSLPDLPSVGMMTGPSPSSSPSKRKGRCPYDLPAYSRMSKTALQKHVSFWDRRKTGVIYPWDTYNGFRALGFCSLVAVSYALAFHLLHTSYWTSTSLLLNPLLPVYVERIHRAKHGSDTGTYNYDGEFELANFERIFQRFDKGNKGGVTYSELLDMMYENRCAGDFLGWSFQFFLWTGLWLLAADDNGVISKKDVFSHFDGSLYYDIEKQRKGGKRLSIWRLGAWW